MNRVTFIFLLLLIVTGATGALAQIDDLAPVPTVPPADSDGDGLPNSDDACPRQPGPRANKGCPEQPSNDPQPDPNVPQPDPNDGQRDTDGDGVLDPADACPAVPGLADNRGCPPADSDGDSVIDSSDECPAVPGLVERAGCPEPDTDGDGFPDSSDECPTVPGSIDTNGCPPFVPPVLPVDGCFVTPATDANVNVRRTPNLAAPVIGTLLSGTVYEAEGYIIRNGTDIWFVLKNYPLNPGVLPGTIGFGSRTALMASSCVEIVVNPTTGAADDLTSSTDGSGVLDPQASVEDDTTRRVSYCEDDLSVWWIVPPFGAGDHSFGLMTPSNCIPDQNAQRSVLDGWKFFMDGLCGEGNYLVTWLEDENGNIIPSTVEGECNQASAQIIPENQANQFAAPSGDSSTRAKEDPAWWGAYLPLMCGGDSWWMIALPSSFNGDYFEYEVVNAGCA